MDENNMQEVVLSAPAAGETTPALKVRRSFSSIEKLFAWICIVLGFFYCKAFPMSLTHFGASIFIVSLYAVTFIVLRGRARFGALQTAVLVSAGLALVSALIWADPGTAFLCFCYTLMAYAYLVYSTTGNSLENGFNDLISADLVRAFFSLPFSSFAKLFPALFSDPADGSRGKGVLRTALKILFGLALAVIPTVIVVMLLSYDVNFSWMLDSMFRYDGAELADNVICFIFGMPVAMYLFGLYFSAVGGKFSDGTGAQRFIDHAEKVRVLPPVTAAAAVLPLLFVYTVFFVSQWGYYTSAFTGVLPEGLSYAEYARGGFFELCSVAFINLLAVVAIGRYMKRGGEVLNKILCMLLAAATLVLIATAMSKLALYIGRYGLTRDRVQAAWFMILLTLLFLIVVIKQFVSRFKAVAVSMTVTVVMLLALSLCGPNRLIAKYNVDKYISGELAYVDVDTLHYLGDDAIPDMLRLEKHMSEHSSLTAKGALGAYLKDRSGAGREYGKLVYYLDMRASEKPEWSEYSLSTLKAERLLRGREIHAQAIEESDPDVR